MTEERVGAVGAVLIDTFKERLGAKLTAQRQEARTRVYAAIKSLLMNRANSAERPFCPACASARSRGGRGRHRRRRGVFCPVRKYVGCPFQHCAREENQGTMENFKFSPLL